MTKKEQRQKVFEKFDGHCAYCGNPLANKFHVDHLIPVKRIFKWENGKHVTTNKMENPELDCFENMMPSCPPCNIAKSSLKLEAFRDIVADKLNMLKREANYRTALRYGLVIESPIEIVFHFEKAK